MAIFEHKLSNHWFYFLSDLCSYNLFLNPADFTTTGLLLSKRFIHATGIPCYLKSKVSPGFCGGFMIYCVIPLMLLHDNWFPGTSFAIERDYYEILGVSTNATREEIKKAFHAVSVFLNLYLMLIFKLLLSFWWLLYFSVNSFGLFWVDQTNSDTGYCKFVVVRVIPKSTSIFVLNNDTLSTLKEDFEIFLWLCLW